MPRVPSPTSGLRRRSTRPLIASLAVAAVAVTPLVGAVPSAHAASAPDLADSMMAVPALATSASISGPPDAENEANAVATTPLAGFPTDGSSFGILSTGRALDAYLPNDEPNTSTDFGGASRGNGNDFDVTVLQIDVEVPVGVNCLSGVDFRFLSEEFPEYVGGSFNDAFIAELDESTWTAEEEGIDAPDNFAFDADGNVISINAAGAGSMSAGGAEGTTYDGGTDILSAATPITPGPHSLYFSIFDQGDGDYDSTVLIDNIRFSTVSDVETQCRPGAAAADEPVAAQAPTQVDDPGTADDTYTIQSTTGVQYLVGGVVRPAGTYPGTGTVTVTAEALEGYTLTGPTSFELTFTDVGPTALTSTGIGTATHTVSPAVPTGTQLALVSEEGQPTSSVVVTDEGRYDLVDNSIVFTPVLGFSGTGEGVDYVVLGEGGSEGTYTPTVTAPAGPDPEPRTSTGTGTATQTATVDMPEGGSVTLRDDDSLDVTTLSVPGTGSYSIDPATGAISFVPEAGFTGPAAPVTFAVTDAYATVGTSTYQPTVTAPPAPSPAPSTSTGPANSEQQVNVPVPSGGTVQLVGTGGELVNQVVIANQGTYTVNPTTGIITFTPVRGFTGAARAVTYLVTDSYGQTGEATYAAQVTQAATAAAPGLQVRDQVRSSRFVPVTCTLTTRNATGCTVKAYASVDGQRTLVGTGVRKGADARKVGVRVVLNSVGRALAARPNGARLQLTATVRSGQQSYQTNGSTRVVASKVALRPIYFATDKSTVSGADRAYLRSVRAGMGAVSRVTCTGYADARSTVAYNAQLAMARAKAVCRILTDGKNVSGQLFSRGEKRPVASNATTTGRSLNRRAEVTLRY